MTSTIDYYNKNSKDYFNSTKDVSMTHLYDDFLKNINNTGFILDLGCGSGRDSFYFKSKGYKIIAVDGSEELGALASKLLNEDVIISRFEELNLVDEYDGIWACASLLHVKRDDISHLLHKISNNLKPNGVFYMSFKYGDNEYIDDKGRYFNCYTEESFNELIKNLPQYNIKNIYKSGDTLGNRSSLIWLNVLLSKN